MTSLVDKLDPRNINWRKSPHKVTPEISAKNDAKIDELEKEQKLLASKLKRGVYKSDADFKQAWEFQNRSFQRILDHRDAWDETTSKHPRVNKQREIEKDRFMGNAIAIQNKYDNVISKQAQKQGVCGYLSEKTCSKGKDCYWFGANVIGKDVGCYSRKEPRKNWSAPQPIKRSKTPNLTPIRENLEGGKKKTKRRKRRKRGGKSRRRKVPLSIIFGTKLSKSTKLKKWRAMKKHQKTKKRKKTRRKRKRRTKRRKR